MLLIIVALSYFLVNHWRYNILDGYIKYRLIFACILTHFDISVHVCQIKSKFKGDNNKI